MYGRSLCSHAQCYSIVSCAPRILIGARVLSLEINQLHGHIFFVKNRFFSFPKRSLGFKTVTSVERVDGSNFEKNGLVTLQRGRGGIGRSKFRHGIGGELPFLSCHVVLNHTNHRYC